MCKRTAIEHGWGCKPPHRAREEEKKNYKGEERGELEERGGERGARAREDWQRRGTTGLVMGHAHVHRQSPNAVMQEKFCAGMRERSTRRQTEARGPGHCAWSWERGGEVVRSAVAMARQRPREVTKALLGWKETTEVAVTEAG